MMPPTTPDCNPDAPGVIRCTDLVRPDFDHQLWHKASLGMTRCNNLHRVAAAMEIYENEWQLAEHKLDRERIQRINQFRDDLAALV